MNTSNAIYQYNGSSITFLNGESVMVNATEMAKPFGKRPAKWLELPSTQDFIAQLEAIRKSDRLIETVNGIGTWFHEDVALEFARWLSPAFAIWCNDRIKELMTQGVATLADDDQTIMRAMQVLQERLDQKNKALQQAEATIQQQAPKAIFADAVASSDTSILIGELAKLLSQNGYPIGQNRLFEYLRQNGYLGKSGERYNIPAQKYVEQGLFQLKKSSINKPDGSIRITTTTKVTGKGQIYFINHFKNKAENETAQTSILYD